MFQTLRFSICSLAVADAPGGNSPAFNPILPPPAPDAPDDEQQDQQELLRCQIPYDDRREAAALQREVVAAKVATAYAEKDPIDIDADVPAPESPNGQAAEVSRKPVAY